MSPISAAMMRASTQPTPGRVRSSGTLRMIGADSSERALDRVNLQPEPRLLALKADPRVVERGLNDSAPDGSAPIVRSGADGWELAAALCAQARHELRLGFRVGGANHQDARLRRTGGLRRRGTDSWTVPNALVATYERGPRALRTEEPVPAPARARSAPDPRGQPDARRLGHYSRRRGPVGRSKPALPKAGLDEIRSERSDIRGIVFVFGLILADHDDFAR